MRVIEAHLIRALTRAAPDASAEDLADAIWLVSHAQALFSARWMTRASTNAPTVESPRAPDAPIEDPREASPSAEEPGAPLRVPSAGAPTAGAAPTISTRSAGRPLRVPGGQALPGAARLIRALRPLRRRVPSATEWVVDEPLTAQRIAEVGIRLPVLRPKPARWLDLALVIDAAASMVLWSETIRELRLLIERLGAFRDIGVWWLDTDDAASVALRRRPRGAARPAHEIKAPNGRRAVFVITDCLAPAWDSGTMGDLLSDWGRSQPVALLQMLPPSLWRRTALDPQRGVTHVYVGATQPGARNSRLTRQAWRAPRFAAPPSGTPIPILTTEPELFAAWANLVTGPVRPLMPAVILPNRRRVHADEPPLEPMPSGTREPAKLVDAFQSGASPLAFRLATLFAAAPLRLPVMRLIQRAIVPESRQVHLAEFFLSGLLKRVSGPAQTDPDLIDYEYIPGVRELLLQENVAAEAVEVQRTVSRYLRDRFGQVLDFQAILEAPGAIREVTVGEDNAVFALVSAAVLERLGGPYAEAAAQLHAHGTPATGRETIDNPVEVGRRPRRPPKHASPPYTYCIVHQGRDRVRAETLYDLIADDIPTFLDTRCLLPGDDWDEAIPRAQRQSRATLVLISEQIDPAYYLREEVASAIALQRAAPNLHRLIPVYLDGIPSDPARIPYGLVSHTGLDAKKLQMQSVVDELRRIAPMIEAECPLPPSVPTVDRSQLYDALCNLLDAQFEDLLFRVSAPVHELSSPLGPRARRAAELIQWAEQSAGRLATVAAVLDRLSPSPQQPKTVFISYSHADAEWKDRLVTHLKVLQGTVELVVRDASLLVAGDDWKENIERQMARAAVAVLMISADFLSSPFTRDNEIAALLRRRDHEQQPRVVPVIVRPCAWKHIPWLSGMRAHPTGGYALSAGSESQIDADLAAIAAEIAELMESPVAYADRSNSTLAIELAALYRRRDAAIAAGDEESRATLTVEIIEHKRRLREAGRLQAGDFLGDGRYQLIEQIGQGGFAKVWKAYDMQSRRIVAIKVLHAEHVHGPKLERFMRGARQMAQLDHPGIVRVFEMDREDGGWYYFVMELVDGEDLDHAVRVGHVQSADLPRIVLAVADTLQYAHERGLIHRDVAPSNILLDQEGRPRLTDFDLVKAADTTGGTHTGALGRFLYAAPEVMSRPGEADSRADVYSLGMTAIFIYSGRSLDHDVLYEQAEYLATLPCSRAIRDVLARAIKPKPSARFASMQEFASAFRAAAAADEAASTRRDEEATSPGSSET